MSPLSLVILISGSGSNLQAIIDQIETGNLNAKIKAVISNRPDAFGLKRALQHGIPILSLDHKKYPDRASFDDDIKNHIDELNPDLIVLAGYMRILSQPFIEHYYPNILNIHPSLLPRYQGLNTHQRALDNGDREHGVSIHVVTPELDAGPVVLQGRFAIQENDDAQSLQQKAHQIEHQMYPRVLQWIADGKLRLKQDVVEFNGQPLSGPLAFDDKETMKE